VNPEAREGPSLPPPIGADHLERPQRGREYGPGHIDAAAEVAEPPLCGELVRLPGIVGEGAIRVADIEVLTRTGYGDCSPGKGSAIVAAVYCLEGTRGEP
jgi:hypothetical protein